MVDSPNDLRIASSLAPFARQRLANHKHLALRRSLGPAQVMQRGMQAIRYQGGEVFEKVWRMARHRSQIVLVRPQFEAKFCERSLFVRALAHRCEMDPQHLGR